MGMVQWAVLNENKTMSMSDKKDALAMYTRREYPPLTRKEEASDTTITQQNYKAIVEARKGRNPRFKIVDANGTVYGCSYSHLIEWQLEPSGLLTLNLSTRIFVLEGKKLDEIDRLLMDEKIKELHVFSSDRHKLINPKATLIQSMRVEEQQ